MYMQYLNVHSVHFVMYTVECNHHLCLEPKPVHHPTPVSIPSPFLPNPPPLATPHPLSMDLPILDVPWVESYTIWPLVPGLPHASYAAQRNSQAMVWMSASFPFHDWIVFHCVFVPHTVYALIDGTPLTVPSFGCYEQWLWASTWNDWVIVILCLTFGVTARLFSKVTASFYIPTSSANSPHPCPHLLLLSLFSF